MLFHSKVLYYQLSKFTENFLISFCFMFILIVNCVFYSDTEIYINLIYAYYYLYCFCYFGYVKMHSAGNFPFIFLFKIFFLL